MITVTIKKNKKFKKPGWEYLKTRVGIFRWEFSEWEFSGGDSPGGSFMGGNFPGGSFPDTIFDSVLNTPQDEKDLKTVLSCR